MPVAVSGLERRLGGRKGVFSWAEEGRYFIQTIIREMETGLLILDKEGRIVECNRAAQMISGYRKREVLGKFYRDVWGTGPPVSPQEREIRIGNKGTLIKSKIFPVTGVKGELLGWVEIFQDRSLLKERMALAEVGEAAAQVAHEIRNPLGGIRGFASLLQREAKEESQEKLISRIADGVANIDKLVNDLLDFTRPQPQSKGFVDLNLVVQEALVYLTQEVELAGIDVQRRLIKKGVRIEGDGLKLRQALLNLLLNGVQAMPQRGRLTIKTFQRGERACLSVSDTGCGIPPQFKAQIFKPFFSRREGGTGLGLALVKKIVVAHKGEISLWSRVGKGTTLSLSFPLAKASISKGGPQSLDAERASPS